MAKRQEFTMTTKAMALAVFAHCALCGKRFESWKVINFDHIIPCAMGGTNDLSNCQAICTGCHSIKTNGNGATTAGSDKQIIAKSNRLIAKANGTHKKFKRKWASRKLESRNNLRKVK